MPRDVTNDGAAVLRGVAALLRAGLVAEALAVAEAGIVAAGARRSHKGAP